MEEVVQIIQLDIIRSISQLLWRKFVFSVVECPLDTGLYSTLATSVYPIIHSLLLVTENKLYVLHCCNIRCSIAG